MTAAGVSSGIGAKMLTKVGSRPVIVAGALIAAAGMFLLGHVPVHGTYAPDILPGLLLVSLGLGPVFVGVTSAANSGVPADKAGVARPLAKVSATESPTRSTRPVSRPTGRALPQPF